ncbi:MAG: peptidoglycan editing factor PgeF [Chloroflexota bacterium]
MSHAAANGVYLVTIEGAAFYRIRAFDDYPNLTHAIFTRQGGVSRSPFAGLNLGVSVGDDPAAVAENFRRVCRLVEITPEQATACHLTHSADVFTVTQANRQRVMGQGDGLITAEPGVYLAMRFGDCTPLIFFDPVRGAVGLTHAGWRGTMKNAAGATVSALVERLGCRPEHIIAVIGPAIGPCCYEVGPEVMVAAEAAFTEANSLFSRRNGRPERAYFDMWAANRRQLAAGGVGQIIESGLCTACRTDLFYSHRAEQGRTGRFGVIIGLKGKTA